MFKKTVLALSVVCAVQGRIKLEVGVKAPDFTLKGDDNKKHSLSDYKGKKIVLIFYPKAFSPWCTSQVCSLRDGFSDYKKHDIVVLGLSYDKVAKLQEFKEEYNLPFTLLSDPGSKTFKKYDAKGILVNDRITYLIDEKGVIVDILKDIDVKSHSDQILKAFGLANK